MTAPRANGAPSSSSKVTGAHAPTVPLRILLLRFSTHPCPRPANTETRTAQPPAPAAPWPGGLRNHQFTRSLQIMAAVTGVNAKSAWVTGSPTVEIPLADRITDAAGPQLCHRQRPDPAVLEHQRLVGQSLGLLQVVRDVERGHRRVGPDQP